MGSQCARNKAEKEWSLDDAGVFQNGHLEFGKGPFSPTRWHLKCSGGKEVKGHLSITPRSVTGRHSASLSCSLRAEVERRVGQKLGIENGK